MMQSKAILDKDLPRRFVFLENDSYFSLVQNFTATFDYCDSNFILSFKRHFSNLKFYKYSYEMCLEKTSDYKICSYILYNHGIIKFEIIRPGGIMQMFLNSFLKPSEHITNIEEGD